MNNTRSICTIAACLVVILVCAGAQARSFVGITTQPSFRLGNDLGRFEWFADLHWSYWRANGTQNDTAIHYSDTRIQPGLGCNIELYDSLFTVYVGGSISTLLQFENSQYSEELDLRAVIGAGIEWPLTRKLSVIGEYMFGAAVTVYPDGSYYDYSFGFYQRPSLQMRYYIGPAN